MRQITTEIMKKYQTARNLFIHQKIPYSNQHQQIYIILHGRLIQKSRFIPWKLINDQFRLFANTTLSQYCWNCGKKSLDDVLCANCHKIQSVPHQIDYFTYLGMLPPKFELDQSELKNRFRQKQAKVHPDKFAQNSTEERHYSAEHSAFLNQAYRTLRNPFTRADYMLELFECEQRASSSTAKTAESEQTMDGELAEQMMELNELIEELEGRRQIFEKIAEIDAQIERLLKKLAKELGEKRIKEGKETMRRIGYFRRSRHLLNKKISNVEEVEGLDDH